jgi:ADP-heptose:LPS heptosyltransferase
MPALVRLLDGLLSTLMRWALRPFAPKLGPGGPPRQIIVIRNCFFGDFIVTIPALRKLRGRFPDARITFLTATSFAPGWRDHPQDDNIFQLEPGLIDRVVRYTYEELRSARGRTELRNELAGEGPVATLTLLYSGDTFLSRCKRLLMCRALGLPAPFGLGSIPTLVAADWLNCWRRTRTDIQHQTAAALACAEDLLRAVDSPATRGDRPQALRWSPPDRTRPVIGLAPFSKQEVKQWPLERFGKLVLQLHREFDAEFEVYGAPAEMSMAETLEKAINGAAPTKMLCGRLTPQELLEHIRTLDVLVCLDSGPMHLASLAGTPVVAIFSQITLHRFWRPWSPASEVVSKEVPCAACNTMNGKCPLATKACIDGIDVGLVMERVRNTLASRFARSPLAV